MTDYAVAIHEGAHAVVASLFNIPYVMVSVRERDGSLGRLIPNREELDLFWGDGRDPEGRWGLQAYAMVCLAGPVAEGRYQCESLDPKWVRHTDWRQYGGEVDFSNAQTMADLAGVKLEALLVDTAEMLDHDRTWLAVERVAAKLVEDKMLPALTVRRVIGLKG